MSTNVNPCCAIAFKYVDRPIITGPDCVPPNNLHTGQMWFNPCTCTYYFKCGDETELNSCEGYTPLNFKPGAGIQYSGDCENGHFISVKIEQGGGLGFNANGELKIIQQYIPPLKYTAKLEWLASEATSADRFVDDTLFAGTASIGITNNRSYPITLWEQAEFTEVAIKGNNDTTGISRCGARIERSEDGGVTWGNNCITNINPWVEAPRTQTEIGGGYGTRFRVVQPGQSYTIYYRVRRYIQIIQTPDAQPEVWFAAVLATLVEI